MLRSPQSEADVLFDYMSAGDYQAGDMLGGRYKVLGVMGRGSNGVTYRVQLACLTVLRTVTPDGSLNQLSRPTTEGSRTFVGHMLLI